MSVSETKSREFKFGSNLGGSAVESSLRKDNGLWVTTFQSEQMLSRKYVGSQITTSENHHWPPPKGSFGDVGGHFSTRKYEGSIPASHHSIFVKYPVDTRTYKERMVQFDFGLAAPIERSGVNPKWPEPLQSDESELTAAGATAISRCKPTSSASELLVAMGELRREGLPALHGHRTWRDRTLRARNAGDEYLNHQFGWKPLVDEITNFGSTIINSDQILKQYEADRGHTIRRRYSFPVERNTYETVLSTNQMPEGITADTSAPGVTQGGVWSRKTETTISRWFSGAFVYGVPGSFAASNVGQLAAKADRLFGISLTPDTLWNLTPWSWAIDWFTNTGDVLANVGDFMSQGLVMRYGYIMEETVHKYTYSLDGAVFHGKPIPVPKSRLVVTTKARMPANPFGFGITWDGLSSTQGAILAALGISRTR